MPIIEARNISKTYPASGGRRALLGRGGIGTWLRGGDGKHQALAPLSLAIEPGEAVGIIGRNGSGKSTLLKLIAGVSAPTSGSLSVRGRVASLLELGAGFHPMLTGRENIYLNAGLLGMRHAQTDACFEDIVAFSEIGEFIDQTVDTYSSGMYVRLAFSVAIHTNPDIFLVDEVLSVGDESFQRKCRARILELKAAGKTILFVSHDLGTVNTLCDRVLLLEKGQLLARGSAQDTIDFYLRQIGQESGIHRVVSGEVEALFNHGRISLYYRQREVTAPLGLKVQFFSLGSYHESTSATWTITHAGATELEATGELPRLPVLIHIRVQLIENRLHTNVAWENRRPVHVDYVAVQCFFPTTYTRWYYAGNNGMIPAIDVTARQWGNVVPARHHAGPAYLLPPHDSDIPPVCVDIDEDATAVPLQLDITDYMTQACLVHVTEAIPPAACPLPPMRRQQVSLIIDPSLRAEDIAQAQTKVADARSLAWNDCVARMDSGAIAIAHAGAALSDGLNLHLRIRTGGLWTLSQGLQWDPPVRDGNCLSATARTPRLPCTIRWSLSVEDGRAALQVLLDATAPLRIDEYNLSLELAAPYERWEAPEESGRFTRQEGAPEWRYLNQFAPGAWIRACAPSLPPLTLFAASTLGAVHPAAIQIGGVPGGSVIQLLCTPDPQAVFTLPPGEHVLFRGHIVVGASHSCM